MTINELIAEMQRRANLHGGESTVQTTWEGVFREIKPENVYLDKEGFLLLDAGDNFYKSKLQHPDDLVNNSIEAETED